MEYKKPTLTKCGTHEINEGIEAAGVGTVIVGVVVIASLIVTESCN